MYQISSFIHSIFTPSQSPSQSETGTENLRESITAFVNEVVVNGELLNHAQRQTAEELKLRTISLFPPEKQIELYEYARQTDPEEKRESKQMIRGAQIALDCWSNRNSGTEVLEFLKGLHKSGDILWTPAPALTYYGIKGVHQSVVLYHLSDKEPDLELLKTFTSGLMPSELNTYIKDEETTVQSMKSDVSGLHPDILKFAKLKNEKFREKVKAGEIGKNTESIVKGIKNKRVSINKKKKNLKLLRTLHSFLITGETDNPKEAFEGVLKYLDHLVDKVQEPEACVPINNINEKKKSQPSSEDVLVFMGTCGKEEKKTKPEISLHEELICHLRTGLLSDEESNDDR